MADQEKVFSKERVFGKLELSVASGQADRIYWQDNLLHIVMGGVVRIYPAHMVHYTEAREQVPVKKGPDGEHKPQKRTARAEKAPRKKRATKTD